MEPTTKLKCDTCGWFGTGDKALIAPNPFDAKEQITGCPRCKAVENFTQACDEPNCWSNATCGTPTKEGYRHTCGRHRPTFKEL